MAIVLTEQTRLFSPESDDPRQFGDGAPMHSNIAYDLVRSLNNLQTYCEPSAIFAFDSCYSSSGNGSSRMYHTRPTVAHASSGVAMMGQLPIPVPVQAKRMRISFGFYRDPATLELPIAVNITDFYAYLASGPCKNLQDPIVPNPAPVETARLFLPEYIDGPYSVFHIPEMLMPASASDSGTSYTKLRYFDGTSPAGTFEAGMITPDNINDRQGAPWANLIIALGFSGMGVGESFRAAELSVHWEYQ